MPLVIGRGSWQEPFKRGASVKRENPILLGIAVLLAAVCLVLGLFPDRLTALFQSLAAQVL